MKNTFDKIQDWHNSKKGRYIRISVFLKDKSWETVLGNINSEEEIFSTTNPILTSLDPSIIPSNIAIPGEDLKHISTDIEKTILAALQKADETDL